MRIVKCANQQRAMINIDYYNTEDEYRELEKIEGVDDGFYENRLCVLFSHVKELTVVLDEKGYYTTAAVMNSGELVYIELG